MFDTSQPAYLTLRNLVGERTTSIVAWVGSGLSANADIPTWPKLKLTLLDAFKKKIATIEKSDENLDEIAQRIEAESNYWRAFEMLQKQLGHATYQDIVREALRPATTAPAPQPYIDLWKLRIRGLLNLNIDRLATKAYLETNNQQNFTEFNGNKAAQLTHILKSPDSFIANLHGSVEDASSWIFTSGELKWLLKDEAYRTFIRTVLLTNTILFLGISADDLSVGGHLESIAKLGIDGGSNFWLTDRHDAALDTWAESVGIRLIRYSSKGTDHSALNGFFSDLLTYVPQDDQIAPPITPKNVLTKVGDLPSPIELLSKNADVIRQALNLHAIKLLGNEHEDYAAYESFCKEYDEAIYRAWYLSTVPGKNNLLGYTLTEEVAQGAFGKVYRAIDADGRLVAAKILLEEIRQNPELLQCFRRGVRSMRILAENKVKGMVPYKEATEIPALVVMDWIDGPNLGDAIKTGLIKDWETILRIADELADIIRQAHQIPERVLHRDLRPSNIMLQGFFTTPEDWKVVVLDFDLSWHRGATEKSVMHSTGMLGYLAPEQINVIEGVSTRHAAVDSFGIGMTLFYIISKTDPVPAQNLHTGWKETVHKAVTQMPCLTWKSTPSRFARIILKATQNKQSERWDMSQIQGELERLREAVSYPLAVNSADMIAEEIASRCTFLSSYAWDDDKNRCFVDSPSGIRIEIRWDEAERKILLDFSWNNGGAYEWKRIGKYLPKRMTTSIEMLKKDHWHIETQSSERAAMNIGASIDVAIACANLDLTAGSIQRVCENFHF